MKLRDLLGYPATWFVMCALAGGLLVLLAGWLAS